MDETEKDIKATSIQEFELLDETEKGVSVLIDSLGAIYPNGNLRLAHINGHLRREE